MEGNDAPRSASHASQPAPTLNPVTAKMDNLADVVNQHKLQVPDSSHIDARSVTGKLKLGLFSYPVLQAADILVHRFVRPSGSYASYH